MGVWRRRTFATVSPQRQGGDASRPPDLWNKAPSSRVKNRKWQKEPNRKNPPYRTEKSSALSFFLLFFFPTRINALKKTRDRFENPRKASTTEQNWLLNTTFTETTGLLRTKKAYYYVQS